MFENKQLCFSLFLGEYRVKKVAFSGFFFSFFDGMSCANDDVDPSVPDEVHEVVDEVGGGEAGQRETVAEIADARGLCPRIASRERQPPLPGLGLTAGQDQAPQPFGLIWLYTEARACLGTSKNSCYLCSVAEPVHF